jgi:hypothetical protein
LEKAAEHGAQRSVKIKTTWDSPDGYEKAAEHGAQRSVKIKTTWDSPDGYDGYR